MGVAAEEIPVTREDQYGWMQEWDALPPRRPARKKFFADKMDEKYGAGTSTTMVDVTEHASIPGYEITLIDMVMRDLDSYA